MQGRLAALEKLQDTAARAEELEERIRELQLVVQNKDGDLRRVHDRAQLLERQMHEDAMKREALEKKLAEEQAISKAAMAEVLMGRNSIQMLKK